MTDIPAEEINDTKALRHYLESFHPNHPYPPLTKENTEEIITVVPKVLSSYTRGEHGRELQQHYAPDIETSRITFAQSPYFSSRVSKCNS